MIFDGQLLRANGYGRVTRIGAQEFQAEIIVPIALTNLGPLIQPRSCIDQFGLFGPDWVEGAPPDLTSDGSVGARTTTTSVVSVALRSRTPALRWAPIVTSPLSFDKTRYSSSVCNLGN